MTFFDPRGHLTEDTLTALIRQDGLTELERLELAEHLAYCDHCLQRYTLLLEEPVLLTPAADIREPLLRRIRARAFRLLTHRWATAAAAVLLALTLLWADRLPVSFRWEEAPVTELSQTLPERWNSALSSLSGQLRDLLDSIELPPSMGGDRSP